MRKVIPGMVILGAIVLVIALLFFMPKKEAKQPPAQSTASNARTPVLLITSVNNEAIQQEFKAGFEVWHRDKYGEPCAVEWRDHGGTSDAVRFIKSEFTQSPNSIGLDIIWGGGIEPYLQFAQLGILAPCDLPHEIMSLIPPDIGGVPMYDNAHTWYGTALSGFGIMYNRQELAALKLPEPNNWMDIADPAYFGRVAAADPRNSGTAQVMIETMLQAYGWQSGWECLTRMAGNVRTFTRSAGAVPTLVSNGEAAAGLAIDFYAWAQIAKDGKDKIGYVLPEGLSPFTPDCIAILKGAPNMQYAKRFVEYVMSPEGQRLWLLPKGYPGGPKTYDLLRIPVLPSVYTEYASVTNVIYDPEKAKKGLLYDSAKASARRDIVKDIYGALLIDLSPELAAAWKAVIARGMKPEEVAELCAPPVTEQESMELAKSSWSDPVVRNNKLVEWTTAAKAKYERLARQ